MRPFRCNQNALVPIRHTGFTLVEMLVVIGILLLIAAITLGAINLSISGDRVRGGARQVQSYLEGARSRAVYGGNVKLDQTNYQCGVRFIPEPNNPTLITSMVYVERPADYELGMVSLERADFVAPLGPNEADSPEVLYVRAKPTATASPNWFLLARQGLISDDCRIWIGDTRDLARKSQPYRILTWPMYGADGQPGVSGVDDDGNGTTDDFTEIGWPSSDDIQLLRLSYEYPNPGTFNATPIVIASSSDLAYLIELSPQPMPNQEPRQLGNGVVLDMNLSNGISTLIAKPSRMDIMFSPRGTVVGPLSSTGIVSFVLSDREDSLKSIGLSGTSKRERLIVTLTPQTGMTAVHPVYPDSSDPFRYAETGEIARQ